MKNKILLVNEYNNGYGNVMPLVKIAYSPKLQELGDTSLLLSRDLNPHWGVEYDKLECPTVEVEREVSCYEDTLMNTVVGIGVDELLECVNARIKYLEDNEINFVILRDSPIMAIAAYVLGIPRIFYQCSISIPPINKWKRKLTNAPTNYNAHATIMHNVNEVLTTLGIVAVEELADVFSSGHNVCSDYPMLDAYRGFNTALKRTNVTFAGLLKGEGYAELPPLGRMRVVISMDGSQEDLEDVIVQIKNAPYKADIIVFNTPTSQYTPWADKSITFVGDSYQPIEPYLVGASVLICSGGSTSIIKALSCSCLPVLINPTPSIYVEKLKDFGLISVIKDSMGLVDCCSLEYLQAYYKRVKPVAISEFSLDVNPLDAIIESIGDYM